MGPGRVVTSVPTATGTSPSTTEERSSLYFEELGWPGRVFRPGNGAKSCVAERFSTSTRRHFDIHYRNLDVVALNKRGPPRQLRGPHPGVSPRRDPDVHAPRRAGGKLEPVGRTTPTRPIPMRSERAPHPFGWAVRTGELDYARYRTTSVNPISCAGTLAKVVLQGAHARLADRGIWALNEKRMVQWATPDQPLRALL